MFKKYILAFFSFFLLIPNLQAEYIIWDLGDVLFKQGKWGMAKHIGYGTILEYMLRDWQLPWKSIKPILFDIFDAVEPKHSQTKDRAPMPDGSAMPTILCDWQAGKKSGAQCVEILRTKIEQLDKKGYFLSSREKNIIIKSIESMFNPNILGQYTYEIPAGVKLLRDCAAVTQKNGTKRHTLAVLSNWTSDSFRLTHERYPEIFNLFGENIVISGKTGYYKPQTAIYTYCLNQLGALPHECIFIDDQKVNIDAARKLGIKAIQLVNNDYAKLRAELEALGVFKP